MTRVSVIGNAGGGKSTLSRAISAAHGLPYHAIDLAMWQPDWVRVPDAEFDAWHAGVLQQPQWVLDGFGPWKTVNARLAASDTIVLVDLPLATHLWWAMKRQLWAILFGRDDAPAGCRNWPVTLQMLRMIWWLHREMRQDLIEAVYAQAGHARIVHLRTTSDLRRLAAEPV